VIDVKQERKTMRQISNKGNFKKNYLFSSFWLLPNGRFMTLPLAAVSSFSIYGFTSFAGDVS